ncbi:hypothetical protein ACGFWF_45240 [Streptomyces sp. NPDC048581]|uniref:hypothetical protein n=1 Tax=Streptomyces sp. NPDC048581 TaxID=3365572 RepID=UPI00372382C6
MPSRTAAFIGFVFHAGRPGARFVVAGAGMNAVDGDERFPYGGGHAAAVAADEHASAGLEVRPDLVAFRGDAALDDAGAVLGRRAEGGAQADGSGSLGGFEFLAVEVVDVGVVAADVAQRGAGGAGAVAVEDGAAEGGQSCWVVTGPGVRCAPKAWPGPDVTG